MWQTDPLSSQMYACFLLTEAIIILDVRLTNQYIPIPRVTQKWVHACIERTYTLYMGISTLAYEIVRKGYSERRKSYRKVRKKQYMYIHVKAIYTWADCNCHSLHITFCYSFTYHNNKGFIQDLGTVTTYMKTHVYSTHYIAKVVAEEEKKGRKPRPNKLHM